MRKFISLAVSLALTSTFLSACGCAQKSRNDPSLATVSGTVTMDGKPLEDVCVHFIPESGRESVGMTDKYGRFEVCYLPSVMGAKIGRHSVAIDPFINDDTDIEEVKSKRKIPDRYNSKTTLKVEIKAGNNVCNFDLKSN